jgi:hypothetical protein
MRTREFIYLTPTQRLRQRIERFNKRRQSLVKEAAAIDRALAGYDFRGRVSSLRLVVDNAKREIQSDPNREKPGRM